VNFPRFEQRGHTAIFFGSNALNTSLEPTPVGACMFRIDITSPAWLSFGR
jgi:hypothetical protein